MALTKYGHEQFAQAAEGIMETLGYAELAFGFLGLLHSEQDHKGNMGFEALTKLCALGCKGVLDQHGEKVEQLIAWHRKQEVM